MIWGDAAALARARADGRRGSGDRPGARLLRPAARVSTAPPRSPGERCATGSMAGAAAAAGRRRSSASTLPELLDDAAAWRFAQAGVAAVAGLRTGLRCAAAMRRAAGRRRPAARDRGGRPARGAASARRRARWLTEHEAKALLRARGRRRSSRGGRRRRGRRGGRRCASSAAPVALKLELGDVQHKSGARRGRARPAHAERRRGARTGDSRGSPRSTSGAMLIERMAPPGVELIVAARARRDRAGAGARARRGVDRAARRRRDRAAARRRGAGRARAALAARRAVADAAAAAARRSTSAPSARLATGSVALLLDARLELIELNPVIAGRGGAIAVDAFVDALGARSAEQPLEARAGGQPGLDRAVDEAGPAVREVRAGQQHAALGPLHRGVVARCTSRGGGSPTCRARTRRRASRARSPRAPRSRAGSRRAGAAPPARSPASHADASGPKPISSCVPSSSS